MDIFSGSFQELISSGLYEWFILPLIIFVARICDVTLGTLRIIFVSRNKRKVAPILGFFEVLIWVVVIAQIVQHLHSVISFIAYALGFATGNYIGMLIEDRLAIGMVVTRVILHQGGNELANRLQESGFGVTLFDGMGSNGPVKQIVSIIRRQDLKNVCKIIHSVAPKAFVSVEDVRSTEEGIFPDRSHSLFGLLSSRKSK